MREQYCAFLCSRRFPAFRRIHMRQATSRVSACMLCLPHPSQCGSGQRPIFRNGFDFVRVQQESLFREWVLEMQQLCGHHVIYGHPFRMCTESPLHLALIAQHVDVRDRAAPDSIKIVTAASDHIKGPGLPELPALLRTHEPKQQDERSAPCATILPHFFSLH